MRYKEKVIKLKPDYTCEPHGATKVYGGEPLIVHAIFEGRKQITQHWTTPSRAWAEAYKLLTGIDVTNRRSIKTIDDE